MDAQNSISSNSTFALRHITPKVAVLVAVLVAMSLSIMKLFVGLISGSVAIIASGVDSLLDVGVSLFNLFVLNKSDKPANRKFHYGFGKLESIASSVEGVIIALSGVYIFYISVKKLYLGSSVDGLDSGLWVMLLSCVATLMLVLFLSNVNKRADSQVLKADILHYKTDLLSNLAILVTLLVVKLSGFDVLDSILGIIISIYIIYQAGSLIKDGVSLLLDRAISDANQQKIESILNNSAITSYHALRTRRVRDVIYVDVHLVFDDVISLRDAHSITQGIEDSIRDIDKQFFWDIVTHLDPEDDSHLEQYHKHY